MKYDNDSEIKNYRSTIAKAIRKELFFMGFVGLWGLWGIEVTRRQIGNQQPTGAALTGFVSLACLAAFVVSFRHTKALFRKLKALDRLHSLISRIQFHTQHIVDRAKRRVEDLNDEDLDVIQHHSEKIADDLEAEK